MPVADRLNSRGIPWNFPPVERGLGKASSATLDNKTQTEELIKRILHLSYRVSTLSAPMKPFIRFSHYKDRNRCKNQEGIFYSRLFWDFDDLIQKRLLRLLYEIATPDTIAHFCIDQWKSNLDLYYRNQKRLLERTVGDNCECSFNLDYRTRFIVDRVKHGDRLLYVGCGSGRECLILAKKGIRVVGIDSMAPILDVAKGWAVHLDLPVDLICMDVTKLGFKSNSFDSFLFEFYGSSPSFSQTLALQRALADILNIKGRGFVIASRKKYPSFWFLMGRLYPPPMVKWLIPQASLDFLFSKADSCEERLSYGLYNRSHTLQSLYTELRHTFDVTECLHERDPRYIIAVVKPKDRNKSHDTTKETQRRNIREKKDRGPCTVRIEFVLKNIEALCDQLEVHANQVSAFFKNSEMFSTNNCLHSVPANVSELMGLLKEIVLPENSKGF